jgi:predicted Fe-Mo cluster-binding NifX family protein
MNIAIPVLKNNVAPCFEAAKEFKIFEIENGKVISSKTVECSAGEGFKRVRLLHLHDIETLICSGIKEFYRNQLTALGLSVIPNINETIENVISRFIADELPVYKNDSSAIQDQYDVSHDDLIGWAKELFESNGYKVTENPSKETLLLDLIAEIQCPYCNKVIKVAICCGGHTYRPDQEIKEFHHSVKSPYNVRAFIYGDVPQIAKNCDEYGIEFISPESISLIKDSKPEFGVPILTGPVEGHDKINIQEKTNRDSLENK